MDHQTIEEVAEEQPPGQRLQLSTFSHLKSRFQVDTRDSKPHSFGPDFFEQATLEVVSDIDTCRELWESFTPKHSLFDTWEFRYSFWLGYHHRPFFMVIRQGEEVWGLMPLWFDADHGHYCWFGSYWQENNTFFVKDKRLIPIMLEVAPSPLNIIAILPEHVPDEYRHIFTEDDSKYVLDISSFGSVDDYLATLKKKKRYNIRRDYRLIEEQHPQVIIDRFEDFDILVELSKNRFSQKGDEADWVDPRRIETFRQVIYQGKRGTYTPHMVTVEIDGQVASVDLVIIYNNTYHAVKCAYNVADFPGIGSYVNTLEIIDALNLGCTQMDFLQVSFGWKDSWFTAKPLYKFEK